MIDLTEELKKAFREKNESKKTIVKELKGRVKNFLIEKKKEEISEQDFLNIIKSTIKMTKETIDGFQEAGRNDIVSEETEKLDYLQTLLPPQLSEDEIDSMISSAIESTSASSIKDMGKVMGMVKKAIQESGKDADNSLLASKIKEKLA